MGISRRSLAICVFIAFALLGCKRELNVVEPNKKYDLRILLTQDRTEIYQSDEAFRYDIAAEIPEDGSEEIWLLTYDFEGLAKHFPALKSLGREDSFAYLKSALKRGSMVEPPAATEVYSLNLSWQSTSSTTYVQRDWLLWKQRIEKGFLGFYFDAETIDCPYSLTEISTSGTEIELMQPWGVTFSSTSAFIVSNGSGDTFLTRVDGTQFTHTKIRVPLGTNITGFTADGLGKLYLSYFRESDPDLRFLAYDESGQPAGFIDLDSGHAVHELSIGTDHSIFLCGPSGLYRFDSSGNSLVRQNDFPELCKFIEVENENRIWVVDRHERGIYFFDGQKWTQEHSFFLGDNATGVGGDAKVAVMYGPNEAVFVRDEASQHWDKTDLIVGAGHWVRGIAGLGDGRFALAGNRGLLAIRRDGYWCPFQVGEFIEFWGIDAAPDGSYAIASGSRMHRKENETLSVIYRIDLKD